MDIIVRSGDLVAALAVADRVVSRKPVKSALGGVLVRAEADVTFSATDLEIALRGPIEATVQRPGAAVLPVKTLYDLARTLGDAPLRVSVDEAGASVTGGGFRGKLQVHPVDDFPSIPAPDGPSVDLPRAQLRDMIARVRFAVKSDDSRYFLDGAYLELRPGSARLTATDGHRLATAEAPRQPGDGPVPVIVPRKTLDALASALDDPDHDVVTYSQSGNHLFFSVGSRLLVSRIVDGQFPSYERIIPRPTGKPATIERAALAIALKRAGMVADATTRKVALGFGAGGISVSVASAAIGEANESVDAAYGGDDAVVGVNVDYTLDFLDAASTEQVEAEPRTSRDPIAWRAVDGDVDYRYVLMPVVL